jgi:N-acetyl-anhydromuramyl-L-alanine amidase AmpD/V8-like Glu-specific endopeptidase
MAVIRANRESIDDRFSVLGFTVRSELPLFEIGLATDPDLLKPQNRAKRTPGNFFTSRLLRALPAQRGEAVYLVPPDVVARFVGQQRLYFGLATYRESDRSTPISLRMPDRGTMYVSVSGLTERGLRRTVRSRNINAYGNTGYGGNGTELAWGGDAAGATPPPSRDEDRAPQAGNGAGAVNGNRDAAGYSDGFSDELWKAPTTAAPTMTPAPVTAPAPANAAAPAPGAAPTAQGLALRNAAADDEDSGYDIGGPIPDEGQGGTTSAAQGLYRSRSLTLTAPEYPMASRFEPANPGNYRAKSTARTIDRIVIHITDGSANINGTISWFKNPAARVSAHYVIGLDGEVVQMVAHNDVAWHAGTANGTSIGIEHVANTRGLNPTAAQMCASAALVTWLCDQYSIPADGTHILGHAEADSRTTHRACPNAVWDWVYYMDMITTRTCYEPASISPTSKPGTAAQSLGYGRALADTDTDAALDDDVDADMIGIDQADVPVDPAAEAQSLRARGMTVETPDYPDASRFAAAHRRNYTASRKRGVAVDRIVIHITAGGPSIEGTIGWFQNGNRVSDSGKPIRSSAHYIVGRDGEVVQMVRNAHTAHHVIGSNWRSIGIEHNANKPSRRNRRDLPPTELQYEYSAKLVAWLCQQYGIPADREHIVGHIELADNHDCPTSYWDWDHYMTYVQAAVGALAYAAAHPAAAVGAGGGATAQGLALRGGGYAKAQEIITPFYDPADPYSALTCQNDAFSLAREEWFVGVENTQLFPHSAICLLQMSDGSGGTSYGTGFYIGRNRILTCAHNLSGKASAVVTPGKNGAGNEPFGSFTVNASSWRVAPRYGSGGSDNDLAVIDNVPIDAPNGQWFEFLNATPSDRMPLVVCGYSRKSDVVPALTALMDGNKQHLHGGYAQRMPTPDTIDYPILTLHRASGSPVYTLRDDGSGLRALVCAVHVSGAPAADGLNRGCFITPTKIDWIEGRAATFALAANARGMTRSRALGDAFSLHWHDVPMTYQTSPMSCWAAAASMVVGWRDQQSIPDSVIADKVAVLDAFRNGLYGHERGFVADAWNLFAEAPASYTIEAWRDMLANNGPLYIDQVANAASGGGHVRVLVGMTSGGAADGSDTTMYMHDPARGPITLTFAAFLALYEGRTANTGGYLQFQIMHSGGVPAGRSASSTAAFSLGVTTARAQAYGRALANDAPSDMPVHLIPQPNKDACWAAAMAMLLAHRRQQSRTPESIVNDVGGSLASSYGWDLIDAVKARYGFEVIPQPSNASIYHTPRQWAEWLNTYGPLWVVIVGAPHAVVVAGIRGDLGNADATQVKILNPWDTRVAFDNDPIEFHPANSGYEDWLPFADFAADFGNMAEADYGNWRILHLPAAAAQSQSLSMRGGLRLARPPSPVRPLEVAAMGERREPVEPTRVLGTRMSRVIGEAGGSRWSLDQLEGMKSPATLIPSVGSAAAADVHIDINDWPAIEGAPTPLPLTIDFRTANGSVGDVRIAAGTPANLAYGVEVVARIEDCADADGVARLRIRIDYRFRGLSQGNPDATIELNVRGDGRHERENGWRNTDVLSPAA